MIAAGLIPRDNTMRCRCFILTAAALAWAGCWYGTDEATPDGAPTADGEPKGRATTAVRLASAEVVIEYGRPELTEEGYVRGTRWTPSEVRSHHEAGFVWRLGRNEATTLTTTSTLLFDQLRVPAGSYSLFARKEALDRWSLVFNRALDQWGALDYDPAQDLGAVPLEIDESDEPIRLFTIELRAEGDRGRLELLWGYDRLGANFSIRR